MKKILLSLSALTIGVTPAVTLLSSTEKHVITKVTTKIQKKIDESALLFKAPIITNAQKQNAEVTTNWLNDQAVSNISHIDSNLSYADFNDQTYDMKSANKTLNKIYKQDGYKHKNEDALQELLFGTADKGLTLLENSIDENRLKPEGVNEFLNWISYISFGSGLAGALDPKSIDKTLVGLNKKFSWLKIFKNTPIPTLSKLNNYYDVYTFQDLQDFASINIANLLAEISGFQGSEYIAKASRKSYKVFIPKEFDLKFAKLFEKKDPSIKMDTSENPDGKNTLPWFKDNRNLMDQQKDFYQAVISHIIDGEDVSIKFEINEKTIGYIVNILYSLSWYISSFDKYTNVSSNNNDDDDDDNHLFSATETNKTIFKKQREQKIEKNDTQTGLKGILSLFKSLFVKEDNISSKRVLKLLFQPTENVNNAWGREAWLSLLFPTGFAGEWTKNSQNNGLTLLINNALIAVIGSKKVASLINIPSSLSWLLGPTTGSTIGNVVNAILANNDLTKFFKGLSTDGILNTLIGTFVKELKDYLKIIGSMADDGFFDHLITKLFSTKLNVLVDYIKKIMTDFGNVGKEGEAIKPQPDPSTLPNKSILEFMNLGFGSITIGNLIWKGLNLLDSSLPEIMNVLGLLGSVASIDAANNYNFYIKGKGNNIEDVDLKDILGYDPAEFDNQTSDIALAWSMMRFINTETNKNKVVGIRAKNSNGTTDEILWGHRAWKYILGYDYNNKNYVPNSLLGYFNDLLTSGLTSKIIQAPIKFARKYLNDNLGNITYNRNKVMTYWSNKDLFTTNLISYDEDSNQENLKYNIVYKVKKDVYVSYEVSVYKEFKNNKYKISSFNRI